MLFKWMSLATEQAGAISTSQLDALGVSVASRKWLVSSGRLIRVRRGLYVLAGSEKTWRCRLWLALLDVGSPVFVCRRSAAAVWALDGFREGTIEVGVPPPRHPRTPEVIRYRTIGRQDLELRDGMLITTPARTLVDVAGVVDASIVERSLECVLRRQLTSVDALRILSAGRTPGARVIRNLLDQRPLGLPPTESDAETLFVFIARSMALPEPIRQYPVRYRGRDYRLDFAWPERRLASEVDGGEVHGPGQLTADLRRQNQIVLAGWTILRFSWSMIVYDPDLVRRDLGAAWMGCAGLTAR